MSYCVYPSILDMEKTLVCIQKINSDLVPKSERLICLVSEAQFVFLGGEVFLGSFCFQRQRKWLFCLACLFIQREQWTLTSPVSNLLTSVTKGDIDHTNTRISNAPWDLKSPSKDMPCFPNKDLHSVCELLFPDHVDFTKMGKLAAFTDRHHFLRPALITFADIVKVYCCLGINVILIAGQDPFGLHLDVDHWDPAALLGTAEDIWAVSSSSICLGFFCMGCNVIEVAATGKAYCSFYNPKSMCAMVRRWGRRRKGGWIWCESTRRLLGGAERGKN